MRWDVVVIGAGAAGLLAAARAAERGRRVLLLEKNRKPGVKILMSGGTRCNLTHATDARGIVEAFGPPGRFLHSALAALSPQDMVALIEGEGVATKVEATGKIFPVSNKATDVLAALLRRLKRSGCTLAWAEAVRELTPGDGGFQLVTTGQALIAEKVIITTGGQSYPGCGTTGDGYGWMAALGHTIVPPRPSLVPVTVNAEWVGDLKGVTVPDVAVRVMQSPGSERRGLSPPFDGMNRHPAGINPSAHWANPSDRARQECLAYRRGSFLFTHFGLSGPVVLDVSRAISGHSRPEALQLECDFLPGRNEEELSNWLQHESSASGKKQLAGILAEHLPRRLCEAILPLAGLAADRKAAALSKAERARLVGVIKRLAIPVTGTLGFAKAEVTAGGVSLDEVDSRTMESKRTPGLYLAGEILDLDGPIGGYNFQAAFSTGWLAGQLGIRD